MAIVLLDLEQTVIDDWEQRNALTCNIERIAKFLQPDDQLGLMSWAIWDGEDKHKFQTELQLSLEEALKKPFTQEFIFSMMDFSDIILKRKHKWVSKEDMFDLFGKEECLLQLLRLRHFAPGAEIFLIDDCVSHGLTFRLDGQRVEFINVDAKVW